jgi:hypothetical protein
MTKPKQEPEKNILKRPAEAKAGLPAGIVLDRIRILPLKIMDRIPFLYLKAVLVIRIRRILMFLGLPDPDPLVRGKDPDPSLFLIQVLSRLK